MLSAAFAPARAQERGAAALGELIDGLGVNARVLMIGAHPDDEDTFLITWLQRGRHVETAYLSLTRGDGGQNLIGNELGEALGVIRTEELLAARRIDGAQQYFTRAFDFGFSKDTIDTFRHWTRDSLLGDVVRVVRDFRPHVIIAVFGGTAADGHGHHQVSGLLARAAYDIAGDSVRFPRAQFGAPWTPLKFYRAARFNAQNGTLGMDVGEYSPLLGRSYGEIASLSRSQHKSQGFGAVLRRGPIKDYVRREASRVNEGTSAAAEKSLFDGIDTSWARFRGASPANAAFFAGLIDSLRTSMAAVRGAFDPFVPERIVQPLGRTLTFLRSLCPPAPVNPCERVDRLATGFYRTTLNPDLTLSIRTAIARTTEALRLASGVSMEAWALESWAPNTDNPVFVTIYNRGRDTVAVSGAMASGARGGGISATRLVAPGGVVEDTIIAKMDSIGRPWWLANGRTDGMFLTRGSAVPETDDVVPPDPKAWVSVDLGGARFGQILTVFAPIVMTVADQVKGEMRHASVAVPRVSVTVDAATQYIRADAPIDRSFLVRLQSAQGDSAPGDVRVTIALPRGVVADSATKTVRLTKQGGDVATVAFRVRGRLPAGQHRIDFLAEVGGQTFSSGYTLIDYDHIRRQRLYRSASVTVTAASVTIPGALKVAYIPGVGDNVAPMLAQLGVQTTVIAAGDVTKADLKGYTTVVVGTRAYEAHPELVAANGKLMDFAKNGGALVVQYGQYEMLQPGVMPFPITLSRPAVRVTEEDAAVTIDTPAARELNWPNKITTADFDGWVQERSLYMPSTFDGNYRSFFSMHDRNEQPNKGALLVTPVGKGVYVYTTLSLFRQLPAGVPGGARLFVNLLSAGLPSPTITP